MEKPSPSHVSSTQEDPAACSTKTTRPRQQPGLACEECRLRKLRCDRAQPKCGICQLSGIECNKTTVRQPRGPRAGHIRALKARIAALERRLGDCPSDQDDEKNGESLDPPRTSNPLPERAPSGLGSDMPQQQRQQSPPQQYIEFTSLHQPQLQINVEDASFADTTFSHEPIGPRLDDKEPTPQNYTNVYMGGMNPDVEQPESNAKGGNVPEFSLIPTSLTPLSHDPSPSSAFDASLHDPSNGLRTPMDFSLMVMEPNGLSHSLKSSENSSALSTDVPISAVFFPTPPIEMSPLIRADLDHLYFDRVHFSVPILNLRRYFARAARPSGPKDPFTTLQYAMWTLASSVGTQFQHLHPKFYSYTRSLLDAWETETLTEPIPIEHAQAWALIAIYEITHFDYQLGWISAGRFFRLVQLMKLHEIDPPQKSRFDASLLDLSWVDLESRRRTFWIAYTLDRCINLVDLLPLTLTEQAIFTQLPAPESAFQREQPVKTHFLSEAMAHLGQQSLSPFAESIVLITISGRCLSHIQQCSVEWNHGARSPELATIYDWLDRALADKVPSSSGLTDDSAESSQPLYLFASMVAQATSLLLCTPFSTPCQERGLRSARHILKSVQQLSELSYFKMHPFTPIPLYFCAKFLLARPELEPELKKQTHALIETINQLYAVNKLARVCLMKLDEKVCAKT